MLIQRRIAEAAAPAGAMEGYRQLLGDPLQQVQRLLGHSSLAHTSIYLDHIATRADTVDAAVEELLRACRAISGRDRRLPRKGRRVSFAAQAASLEVDPWSRVSTLRFTIDPPHGGEVLVDFSGLRPRGLALAFARGLFMVVAPRGPVTVRSSIKTYAIQLPRFFDYLAETGDRIEGPADLRASHIDGFEAWLEARGKSRRHAPTFVAKVVAVLRRFASDQPGLIDAALRERLRYVSSQPYVRSRPRDAYSPFIARQLRDAARATLSPLRRVCGPARALTKFRRSRPRRKRHTLSSKLAGSFPTSIPSARGYTSCVGTAIWTAPVSAWVSTQPIT